MKPLRNADGKLAFGLAVLCALIGALGGCGDEELPDGVVAKVGDHAITSDAVRRAVVGQIAIKHSAATMPAYLPADIDACVAARAKRSIGEGRSRGDLRRACELDRDRREAAALRFLIKGEWQRRYLKEHRAVLPTERSTVRWASEHADVEAENLRGVAGTYLLQIRLVERFTPDLPEVTYDQIVRQYETHRKRYVQWWKRFGPVLIVPSRAQADRVAALVRGGRSLRVAAQAKGDEIDVVFSGKAVINVRAATVRRGTVPGVRVVGVTRDPRGWLVYREQDFLPLNEQYSLEEVRLRVQRDLERRQLDARIAEYEARLQSRYQDDTICSDDHDVPECG